MTAPLSPSSLASAAGSTAAISIGNDQSTVANARRPGTPVKAPPVPSAFDQHQPADWAATPNGSAGGLPGCEHTVTLAPPGSTSSVTPRGVRPIRFGVTYR